MADVVLVRRGLGYVHCVHAPQLPIPYDKEPVGFVSIFVPITRQLQITGDYIKIGKCPECGRIFVEEE